MDIEDRLRALEQRYRHALSSAVAAKAAYLALLGERGVRTASLEQARQRWLSLASRRGLLANRMAEVERLQRETSS